MFDSLKYAKILEEVGIPRTHAETHIRVLSDVVGEEMVTKDDLAGTKKDLVFLLSDVRSELKTDIQNLRIEVKTEISDLRTELKAEISELRAEVKTEISDLRAELKADISDLRVEVKADIHELKSDIEKLENRMMIKMGSMMAGFMTLGIAATQVLS